MVRRCIYANTDYHPDLTAMTNPDLEAVRCYLAGMLMSFSIRCVADGMLGKRLKVFGTYATQHGESEEDIVDALYQVAMFTLFHYDKENQK